MDCAESFAEQRGQVRRGNGGAVRLVQLIGRSRATELLLTGNSISPKTAFDYGLVNKLTMGERDALPLSAGFSLLMGVSKEVYDRRSERGVFSRRDLIADGVGIALAAGLILL